MTPFKFTAALVAIFILVSSSHAQNEEQVAAESVILNDARELGSVVRSIVSGADSQGISCPCAKEPEAPSTTEATIEETPIKEVKTKSSKKYKVITISIPVDGDAQLEEPRESDTKTEETKTEEKEANEKSVEEIVPEKSLDTSSKVEYLVDGETQEKSAPNQKSKEKEVKQDKKRFKREAKGKSQKSKSYYKSKGSASKKSKTKSRK